MSHLGPTLTLDQAAFVQCLLKIIADQSFTDYNFSELGDIRNLIRNNGILKADDFLHEDTGSVGEAHRIVTNINSDSVLQAIGEE